MSQPASQPFDAPPQPPKKRNLLPFIIAGIVVAGLMMFAVMGVAVYVGFKAAQRALPGQAQAAPKFAASDWGERKVGEITLQAPCQFGPGPNVAGELPQEVRAMISSMTTYQGVGMPENFIVMLSRVVYVPEVEASLEGAMHGTVTETARRLGDPDPKYDANPIEVSGIEGRHSHYKRAVDGQMMHLETVTVCKENRLWQVQVIYLNEESKTAAKKIIDSVKIEY